MNTITLASPRDEVAAPAKRVLLLGLGNEFLTDDAVGLHVVREVRRRLPEESGVEICEISEMGLSLLDLMVGFDEIVLVDAVETGRAPPGYLHKFDASQLPSLPVRTPHRLGLSEVLALGRQLGLAVPNRVSVLAIEVMDPFTVGTEVTGPIRQAIPGLAEQVMHSIAPVIPAENH